MILSIASIFSTSASTSSRFTRSFLLIFAIAFFTGCHDDAELVRQIQARRQETLQNESKQDHLAETFALLSEFVTLNRERATQQLTYHLNQWNENKSVSARDAAPATDSLPKLAATLTDVIPIESLQEIVQRSEFGPGDVTLLRDAYLFRQAVGWMDSEARDDVLLADWFDQLGETVGEEQAGKLRAAARLFDWTVRNIALEPPVMPVPEFQSLAFPLGLRFEGPGYRQSDYETIWRGRGDRLQRAGVFTQLCLQAEIPAAVLAIVAPETGELIPWCIGVLIGEDVYLFEPELGLPIPGPDQTGIATLAQARDEVTVMRRLDVAGYFDYPFTMKDVQQNVGLLNVRPENLAPRMKSLQESLTGDRRLTLSVDVDPLAKQFDDVPGIAGVRLWTMPLLAELYRSATQRMAERDPAFAFWFFSRWAIMDGDDANARNLSLGRWRHLTGQFEDRDTEGVQGARTLYLSQRAPEFEINDLRIDVELQKRYGIRRQLGVESAQYDRQLQQVQGFMRLGKRTATYWLALVQYDDARYETAGNWFAKRVLDDDQPSHWNEAAVYNLARSLERDGKTDEAIELLKRENVTGQHGNRLRARLLGN